MSNESNESNEITVSGPWPQGGVGDVIENEEWRVERMNEPALLVVMRVTSRVIKSDGWSLGLHSNSGRLFTTICRAATPDEVAAHEAKKQASAERRRAREDAENRAHDEEIRWNHQRAFGNVGNANGTSANDEEE